METVYDHNPTPEEINYIGLDLPVKKRTYHLTTRDGHYAYIAKLYRFRKNKQKMDEYIDKIKDGDFKWNIEYSLYHYAGDDSYRIQ